MDTSRVRDKLRGLRRFALATASVVLSFLPYQVEATKHPSPSVTDRVARIQAAAKERDETDSRPKLRQRVNDLAQWSNWPNWDNWGNWGNWGNW